MNVDLELARVFGAAVYHGDAGELPDTAKLASLGCGNPAGVALGELGDHARGEQPSCVKRHRARERRDGARSVRVPA